MSAPVGFGVAVGGATGAGSLPLRCASSPAAASAVPMRMSTIRCQSAACRSLRSRSIRTECRSVPDVDHSLFGKEIERRGATLAITKARVLHAAERHLRFAADRREVYVQ